MAFEVRTFHTTTTRSSLTSTSRRCASTTTSITRHSDKANAALEGTEWADKAVNEVLKNLTSLRGTRRRPFATMRAATPTTRSSGRSWPRGGGDPDGDLA